MTELSPVRVMTVIGTRPEIIRLSRVMDKLDRSVHHVIVHTGQNYDYELNRIFFEDLELRDPDIYLDAAGNTPAATIGRLIERVDSVFESEKPDALLVLGDTNSCLAVIPAKRRKIPIFHMEAGNRCFDQRVPEETNRKIVDHVADINMPYSSIAREYLLREGLPPDRIIKTGSPMKEVLSYYSNKIEDSLVLQNLDIKPKCYFVVSSHREENVDSARNLENLVISLNRIADEYRLPIIMTTHPRTKKRLADIGAVLDPNIRTIAPFAFSDYVKLQKESLIVLSDSGTITEEASILGFPAINIRDAHERPEGMEETAVIMSGLEPERVLQNIRVAINQSASCNWKQSTVHDYDVSNVSDKVVRIILSYIDYVNRNVWHKNE